MSIDYAARARALVGTGFRPQGRSETELDCVGVILSTFEIAPNAVRRDYRLRGDHQAEIKRELNEQFRAVPKKQLRPGDVMLLEVAREQFHLAVRTNLGFVHAHARIGRVVETPGLPDWPLLGIYRKRGTR
jgi:hypothetical protein